MWPQITYLILLIFSLGFNLSKHGEPREGKENFAVTLIIVLFVLWLQYEGGFYNCFFK